jgi:DNA polymerase epsilon subunit 2
MTGNAVFPRRPLLASVTARLRARSRIHFGSNPCRIKYFGQEIVIVREDLMARMLRNLVGVKPNVREEELKRFVSYPQKTLLHVLITLQVGAINP